MRGVPRIEVVMKPTANRRMVYLTAFITLLTLGAASASEAGPYLRTSSEMSNARSTPECEGQIRKILRNLARHDNRLTVLPNNDTLGVTKDSTVGLECISVGPNERRQDQWIIYISIASTNREESDNLLTALRKQIRDYTRFDDR
jgi:hypothetical protein